MLKINEVKHLYLGVQGENLEHTITIDMNPWLVDHPNGTVSIWHKRNGDEAPTPTGAVLDRDSGVLSWTLTGLDTYVAGDGMAEIRMTENSVIKKTREVITTVSESVTGAGGVTGSGWQDYINIVEGYKNAAETAQDAAEDARDLAHEWATYGESSEEPSATNNAKYWSEQAETAQGLAEEAQGKAEDAQELAETAQGKAEDAQEAAETAQGLAETAQGNAEDSAEDAEAWAIGKRGGVDVPSTDPTYHNNAKFYDGEANTAAWNANACVRNAQTAQGKAETAQGLAETAQGLAEDAQEAAEDARDLAHEWATYGESSETPSATNNAKYWAEQAEDSADEAAQAVQEAIDDTAGDGDTDKLWSANKIYDELELKAPKASPVFTGSISLGRKANTVVGSNSFAVGQYNEASGNSTHVEGSGNKATYLYGHAEGYGTTSSGIASHSEGNGTTASGSATHAEGASTTASGEYSHAEGLGTIASGNSQHVAGKYNVSDSTSIEIIGNGGGTNARKNARQLDANGNEKLKGDIYVGCNDDSTGGTALGAEVAGVKSTIGIVPTGHTVMGDISDVKSAVDQTKADIITVADSAPSAIKTFPDGADDQPMAVQIAIEPIQSGTGDPSPTNVRPITGWTGAKLYRSGKNLCALPVVAASQVSINVSNCFFIKAGTYKIQLTNPKNCTSARMCIVMLDSTGNKLLDLAHRPHGAFSSTGNYWRAGNDNNFPIGYPITIVEDCYVRFLIGVGNVGSSSTADGMLVQGDYEAYEPYAGNSYNITFPSEAGTVYGGTLTVNKDGTGSLVVDRAIVDMGTLTWYMNATTGFFWAIVSSMKIGAKLICENYKYYNVTYLPGLPNGCIWNRTNAYNAKNIVVNDTAYSDASSFKSAMSNVMLVYTLETPVTYGLTDIEVIKTILGLNNVWSDTGNILSVDYPADTKLYVDQVTDKLTAAQRLMELIITTNREDGMKATKAYSQGNLMIVNGALYKATTSIANGATLTVDTNITATTVAAELAALA